MTEPDAAITVTVCWVDTALVLTVNCEELEPSGIVKEAGTTAAVLLLDNFTVKPPVTASPLRLTVPVEIDPPITEDGAKLTNASAACVIISLAVWEAPFRVPVIVAAV